MVSNVDCSTRLSTLRLPVIVMVLAATAVPVGWRPLDRATIDFGIQTSEVILNILGYVPVGIVLAGSGATRVLIAAFVLSTLVEASQVVMVFRSPSAVDVASHVIGAILGMFVSEHLGARLSSMRINRGSGAVAGALACALVLWVWGRSSSSLNDRGATTPGILEAHWKLDESEGRLALDSSGNGLHGRFSNEPRRAAGILAGSVVFDGLTDNIDFGRPSALRLVGSMTISAWINSASFPDDDAAIVSQLNGVGYQLDTTIDTGPRTIGFKLADSCGDLMARYGATPLLINTWYHLAAVYDAGARTLDVYLNGELDNGVLLGSVTGTQRSSLSHVYVGRRAGSDGFEFAGYIDDVRIYSRALTKAEIAKNAQGTFGDEPAAQPSPATDLNRERRIRSSREPYAPCTGLADKDDARIPGAPAALGVLAAVAWIGLWPTRALWHCLGVSFTVGLLLVPATASTLPLWMMPVLSVSGAASVVVSVRLQDPDR